MISSRLPQAGLLLATLLTGMVSSAAAATEASEPRWYDPRSWLTSSAQASTPDTPSADQAQANGEKDYEDQRLHRTINLASRQQVMGQRMLAGYCLAGQQDSSVSSHMFNQAAKVFESQADRLAGKPVAGDPEIKEKLDEIKLTYRSLLEASEVALDATAATTLVELSDRLVTETDELLAQLVMRLDDNLGGLVAESGRQRMLGQRAAALALCKKKGVSASLVEGKIDVIMTDLEQSNRALHASNSFSHPIKRELDAAFTKLGHMKDLIADDQWDSHRMLEATDLFVESMNRATRKLADAGLSSV